jgi:nucleoside-diphosphate-sugar epimerase
MTHSLVENINNKTVHVGRNEETPIATVAKIIMDILGINPDKLEVRPGPVGSAKRRCPDTTLVQSLTGFVDYTPLEVGLRKTVESLL